MSIDLTSLMSNYYNTHPQNIERDNLTVPTVDSSGVRDILESIMITKTYKDVMDALENLNKYEKHEVSTKKSSQYELLNRRARNRVSGIYYVNNNRLFEEMVYKDVGTVIRERNFEEFVNQISDEVHRTRYEGDSSVLNSFKNCRFREDITFIRSNVMRFDIDNPFIFTDTDLKYVGLNQDTLTIEVELKDMSWLDVYDSSKLFFEDIKVYKKGLLNNTLVSEFNVSKLGDKTFLEFKRWFNNLFILSQGVNYTLLDENKVYSHVNELLKTGRLNWEEFLGNEYI